MFRPVNADLSVPWAGFVHPLHTMPLLKRFHLHLHWPFQSLGNVGDQLIHLLWAVLAVTEEDRKLWTPWAPTGGWKIVSRKKLQLKIDLIAAHDTTGGSLLLRTFVFVALALSSRLHTGLEFYHCFPVLINPSFLLWSHFLLPLSWLRDVACW